MKNLETLIENLMAQKELYTGLLTFSEMLNARISSGSGSAEFTPMIVERDAIMEKLKAGDEKIGALLSSPENSGLLENERADKLRKEIIAIVEKIKKTDGELMKSAKKAKDEAMDELGSLHVGKKAVSGYGKTGKPVYAKFIDFKH